MEQVFWDVQEDVEPQGGTGDGTPAAGMPTRLAPRSLAWAPKVVKSGVSAKAFVAERVSPQRDVGDGELLGHPRGIPSVRVVIVRRRSSRRVAPAAQSLGAHYHG